MAIPINPKNPPIGMPNIAPPRDESRLPEIRQQQRPVEKKRERPVEKRRVPRVPAEISKEDPVDDEWAIDERTGKRYKKIPKSSFSTGKLLGGVEGVMPTLHLTDLNTDDLNSEANTYLAHLRVPPNKEEQKELMRIKAEQMRKANAKYAQDNADYEEEEFDSEF